MQPAVVDQKEGSKRRADEGRSGPHACPRAFWPLAPDDSDMGKADSGANNVAV
jgi:hypothetical protein